MTLIATYADLDALYAELPTLKCKGFCQGSCGPIRMSRREWERICKAMGYTPKAETMTCPLLNSVSGHCRVYAERSMICRLWGIAPEMRCPWGCQPSRELTSGEAGGFLRRAMDIGQ